MSPVEIMALLIAVFAVIKLLVLLTNPKAWSKIPECVHKNKGMTMVTTLILAVVALYYLLQEITIVQVFAATLFAVLLILMAFAAYSKEFYALAKVILKDKNPLRKAWLPTIVWIVLILWVLKEIFL